MKTSEKLRMYIDNMVETNVLDKTVYQSEYDNMLELIKKVEALELENERLKLKVDLNGETVQNYPTVTVSSSGDICQHSKTIGGWCTKCGYKKDGAK